MRAFGLVTVLLLGGCVASAVADDGLEQARRNFPPMIMGVDTRATDGSPPFARSCPAAGGRVEQKGGPTFEYLGADPTNPDLCVMRVGGETVRGWYGIWLTDWPGAPTSYPALTRIIRGRTGDVEAFDVHMAPGYQFHDLIRNEGVEKIGLLGKYYNALKLAHYREGFGTNIYRSVSTVWKDMDSGMLLYGTYQHIQGVPVVDDPLIPTRIVAPPR